VKVITSAANPLIKEIKALGLKKYRDQQQRFYAEGLQVLGMAADCGWVPELVLATEEGAKHKVAKVVLASVPFDNQYLVTPQLISRISARDNAAPVLAVYKPRWLKLEALALQKDDIWVVLEGIKDPGNLGTIIRTADASGAKGIILLDDTCDPYSVEAVRASMGSVFGIQLVQARGGAFRDWLKSQKVQSVGTALQTDKDFRAVSYKTPLFVVMGNEQSGLSIAMRDACTDLVKLPMRGTAESLNLAVCTGIMLYEANKFLD
jgi:RNA methyltransferase, TrmH family